MLTVTEVDRCRAVLASFGEEEWVQPLVAKIGPSELWTRAISSFLFELRFGGELVAAAGGWKDVETLIRCYQRPTNDVILDVMNEPTKVHEISGARIG